MSEGENGGGANNSGAKAKDDGGNYDHGGVVAEEVTHLISPIGVADR